MEIISPIIWFIILISICFLSSRNISDPTLKRYFITSYTLKVFGAIFLGLIYIFYYGSGDTINYYLNSTQIYRAFLNDPGLAFSILFASPGDHAVDNGAFTQYMFFFDDSNSFFIVRIGGLLSLITANNYFSIAMIFAAISFSGIWKIYQVFITEYPFLKEKIAIPILFLPSLILWGSGYMKDPIAITGLGYMFFGFYSLFINTKQSSKVLAIFLLVLGIYVVYQVKIYILATFIPASFIWLAYRYNSSIANPFLRSLSIPFLIALFVPVSLYFTGKITEENTKYSYDNIVETTQVTADYLTRISEEGSYYTLSSEFDGSPSSLLRLMPETLFTSWFRPMLWESQNVLMLLSGLENTFLLILFLRGFFVQYFSKNLVTKKSKILVFCFIFSILFGVAIGIATRNFGALARYKVPFLPFFGTALIVWNYKNKAIQKLKIEYLKKRYLAAKASATSA